MSIGFGAMMHYLGGGSKNDPATFYGRKIVAAEMHKGDSRGSMSGSPNESLRLTFDDGTKIAIWDDGQSCCESRYMTTDDDIQSLVGHRLVRIEGKDGPTEDADYDVHETCFVEVATDGGFITLVNHNEHNGYYGGFGLTITVENEPPSSAPTF